jgi:hypothetical protein
MVLTAYSGLSLATNSSCPHRRRIGRTETRLGSKRLRRLDTSNGCQDHTALPYASCAVRLARRPTAHEVKDPPCDSNHAPGTAASTASRPNVRDDGQRPSQRGGTAGEILVIWGEREAECFCRRGWTGSITLDWLGKFNRGRRRVGYDQSDYPLLRLSPLPQSFICLPLTKTNDPLS